MKKISRRDFFKQLVSGPRSFYLESENKSTETLSQWLEVGSFSLLTPGCSSTVFLNGHELLLESDENGIWLSHKNGNRVALRLAQGGVVLANLFEEWPKTRVLSQISGEPVEWMGINKNLEEISHE